MPDYKKAFEILKETIDFWDSCREDEFYYDSGECSTTYITLDSDETKILMECLYPKSDSMDKIIEDFGKIGYYLDCHNNDYTEIWFAKDRPYRMDFRIYKNAKKWYYKKINLYNDSTELEIDELRLLNRILRLWGVEVC